MRERSPFHSPPPVAGISPLDLPDDDRPAGRNARLVDPAPSAWSEPAPVPSSEFRRGAAAAVERISSDELESQLSRYAFLFDPPPVALHQKAAWYDPEHQARWTAKGSRRRYRWLVPFLGAHEAAREQWEPWHGVGPPAAEAMMDVYRRQAREWLEERGRRIALRSLWRLAVLDSASRMVEAGELERVAGARLYACVSVIELGTVYWDYHAVGLDALPALRPADVDLLRDAWGAPRGHAGVPTLHRRLVQDALHRYVHEDLERTNAARLSAGIPPSSLERWMHEKLLVALADAGGPAIDRHPTGSG